jgi:hypothetical protein
VGARKLHRSFTYHFSAELLTAITIAVDILESFSERLHIRLLKECVLQ